MLAHPLAAGFQQGQAEVDAGLGVLRIEANRRASRLQGSAGLVQQQLQPGQAGPAGGLARRLGRDRQKVVDQILRSRASLIASQGLVEQGGIPRIGRFGRGGGGVGGGRSGGGGRHGSATGIDSGSHAGRRRRQRTPWRHGPQTAKELPQPQVWVAFGLVKLKPPPIRAEEKSSCMP